METITNEVQRNGVTGLAYQGRNQVKLQFSKYENGYKSGEWFTFVQARNVGMKVKKGEHGTGIFCGFHESTKKNKKTGKDERITGIKFATVFNRDQCEVIE